MGIWKGGIWGAVLCCALATLGCSGAESKLTIGESCAVADDCASGRCDELVCKKASPAEEGAACSQPLDCLSEVCLADGTCGPGVRIPGAPCTADEQCASERCVQGSCSDGPSPDAGLDAGGDGSAVGEGGIPLGEGLLDQAADLADAATDTFSADAGLPPPSCVGGICSVDGWCWEVPCPQPNTLNALWASSPSDVLFAGVKGTLLHFDGSTWELVPSGVTISLDAMWGSGPTDIYIVGEGGTVLHFDGSAVALARSGRDDLNGIWGSGPTNIFVVGDRGEALRFDGNRWTNLASGTTNDLNGVWGAGPSDVFMVGAQGTIVRHDGRDGQTMVSGTTTGFLYTVWGNSASDVMVGGQENLRAVALRYDGTQWDRLLPPRYGEQYVTISSLWGRSTTAPYALVKWNQLFATTASVYRYSAGGWSLVPFDRGDGAAARAIGGSDPSDIYLAGYAGRVWHNTSGAFESLSFEGGLSNLRAVRGTGPDNIIAVGRYGTVKHYDGQGWRAWDLGLQASLYSVAIGGQGEVYVLGEESDSRVLEAQQWRPIAGLPAGSYYAAWASAGGDLFLGGPAGHLVTRLGGAWTEYVRGAGSFSGIWGANASAVFAVGTLGAIEYYDGTQWHHMSSPTSEALNAIWGSSTTNVYAVGSAGTIVRYDGTARTPMSCPVTDTLYDIWGTGPTDIYAVGATGTILHYAGSNWKTSESGTTSGLYGVWSSGTSGVVVVGNGGSILRKR